jgi:tetratricopeptide (TPR) repeat protein
MSFPRRLLTLALVFICLGLSLALRRTALAQKTPTKAPQKSTETSPPPPPKEEKAPDYSREALVIEQIKTLYRFEKDGTGQRELSLRVRVQSEAALEQFGQLILPYSSANEKLDIDYVRVRKADGSAVTASESDVQDLTAPISRQAPVYTDLRQKHVTVPGLRPGDTLEYHVIWRLHTPLAENHFWLNHDFITRGLIVLDERLEVNIPTGSPVKLKTEKGFEPAVKEQEGRRFYEWKHAILKREAKDKDDKEEARKRKEEQDDPKPPQVQMTTFQSWDEVGQWYAGLQRDRIVPDDRIRAKALELVRGINADKDKVEALYEYVSKNFRYVSISLGQGRYQPHTAADVLANQYGDCKDKHTLLASMLNAAGFRAYPALMNSARKIDPDVPSPGQFDHVISAIPLGDETLWADTTAEVAPFRLLMPPLRDKKALVVAGNAPAKLETTPAEPPFLSHETIDLAGQVNDLGKLTAHAHLTLRGDSETYFRIMFRRTPQSDWPQLSYVLSTVLGLPGEASEIKPSDPAAIDKPFEVDYDFASDDFVDWSAMKAKVKVPLPSIHLADVDADSEDNSKPLQLGPPIDISYRLKLSLPAKYQTHLPVPLTVRRDYAEYGSSYKMEGAVLLAERTYHQRLRELPSARTQDFRAFVAAARADEAQTLSLETEVAGTPAIPDSVKVDELIQAAESAAKNQNYELSEDLLKRALAKEPKHKTARRQLAWVLFLQQKYDAAIAAINEQTKINPFDDYCYDLLGDVYWRMQKYAEAERAYRKQLEVTPLHQGAQTSLGQMLVDWRKYKEAVPELEKAISLNPDGQMLYVSLGRAYLNLGEKEKAIAAFDKAVKLEPGPLVWNDVAYDLALSNVQLDKAQQYAESAVTQVANELRNAEAERLTLDDLQNVASLVAYWDTLGWVHFQKGDVALAEKYINAAWQIGQHSEVGYHLGQIMEKKGKRDEAMHTYALAARAERLVPEAGESLARLAGKTRGEELLKQADNESRDSRTIKLGPVLKGVKGPVQAHFFVVLIPGPGRVAQVAEVKFIRGDEKLRPFGNVLKGGNYGFTFPDETATKVIRRGTLFCQGANGECSFIMMSPEFVTSVN